MTTKQSPVDHDKLAALKHAHTHRAEKHARFAQSEQTCMRTLRALEAQRDAKSRREQAVMLDDAEKATTLASALANGGAIGKLAVAPDKGLAAALAEARDALSIIEMAAAEVQAKHEQCARDLRDAETAVTIVVNEIAAQEIEALAAKILEQQSHVIAMRERMIAFGQASPSAANMLACSHQALKALAGPAPGETSHYGSMVADSGPHQARIAALVDDWRARFAALIAGEDSQSEAEAA
jgi:hypothetical protein